MDISKPGDDQLVGLLQALDVQGGVLLAQPRQSARDLLLIAAGLRCDRHAVGGARKLERGQRVAVLRPQRVPGQGVGELGDGADVAGVHLRRRDVFLAPRKKDLRQPFVDAAAEVGEVHIGFDRSRDDLEVADATELVAAGAEHKRFRRLVGLTLGRRQELAYGRHERSHAQQLRRRAADDRRHLAVENSFAEPPLNLFFAEGSGIEVLLEQGVVALRGCLDQLPAIFLDQLLHVVRDRSLAPLAVGSRHERLQVQKVDDASEIALGADREVKRERPRHQLVSHRGDGAVEVRVLLVELVDDHDPGLIRVVALLPGDLGADRQLGMGADHHDGSLRCAEAAEHLAGEIEEAWRVEDVDLEAVVLREGHPKVDRDLSPVFFRLEVGGRRRLVG